MIAYFGAPKTRFPNRAKSVSGGGGCSIPVFLDTNFSMKKMRKMRRIEATMKRIQKESAIGLNQGNKLESSSPSSYSFHLFDFRRMANRDSMNGTEKSTASALEEVMLRSARTISLR